MLQIFLFLQTICCHRTISDVFVGNWSVVSTYSSPKTENESFYFEIFRSNDANHLKTSGGHLINLSYVDLSGNVTDGDQVYYFNFVQVAPPFVSADIDLGEYGKMHCRISSYNSMHITWVNDDKIVTYFAKKQVVERESKGLLLDLIYNNWKAILFFGFVIIIQFAYRYFTRRMTAKIYKDQMKERLRREKNEKEKIEDNKEKIKND